VTTAQSPAYGLRSPPDIDNGRLRGDLLGDVSCTVLRAGWYRFPPDWGFENRVLPNVIVYVFVGGRVELVTDDAQHWLVRGHVLLTAPDLLHTLRNDPQNPSEFYTMHFSAELYGILDVISVYGFPSVFKPETHQFTAILEAVQGIITELDVADPGCALIANGACCRVLALLWREVVRLNDQTLSKTGQADSLQLTRLAPVFRTIQARYAEPLTLRDLAAVVHLEPAYFSTSFKRATGVSPFRYLADFRLRRARQLLLTTEYSLAQIAVATGFRDPFYLSRVFKKAEGLSPREYRRAQHSPGSP